MHRLTLLVLIATALPLVAADLPPGEVVHLKIRPQVQVRGSVVSLADVLVFSQADGELWAQIGKQPLVSQPGTAAATVVTYEQIERRLHELGVDPARVLLGGATACRITLRPAERSEQPSTAALRQPGSTRSTESGRTLAQVLRAHVNEELSALGGTAEIEFEQASAQFLELTTPAWQFSIRSRGRGRLGLREFRVIIRRDGRTHRTVNVFARVRLSKQVLVARKPLGVGRFVARDEVGLETRLFEREEDVGLDNVEQVMGQQVARFVPAGQMVRGGDLKAVDMVARSRPVTVIGGAGNVHVRLTGVALDSGGYGDIVRVRIGNTRRERRVLRGVVTGLGTVRVAEEGA